MKYINLNIKIVYNMSIMIINNNNQNIIYIGTHKIDTFT